MRDQQLHQQRAHTPRSSMHKRPRPLTHPQLALRLRMARAGKARGFADESEGGQALEERSRCCFGGDAFGEGLGFFGGDGGVFGVGVVGDVAYGHAFFESGGGGGYGGVDGCDDAGGFFACDKGEGGFVEAGAEVAGGVWCVRNGVAE